MKSGFVRITTFYRQDRVGQERVGVGQRKKGVGLDRISIFGIKRTKH